MTFEACVDAAQAAEASESQTGIFLEKNVTPRQRLIVALDFPDIAQARDLVNRLDSTVEYYKIGLELLFGGGLSFGKELKEQGKLIFLDMKLLDISNTVESAVRNISRLGFDYLTVHVTDRKTLDAAHRGRNGSNLKLLGVTVLTNLDQDDLAQQGLIEEPSDLVLRRALLAKECGLDGVIASGWEAESIRTSCGSDFLIKVPGIRPSGAATGDQSRVMTPGAAIAAGADYLVVGRPITQAPDPVAAAEAIVDEIGAALPAS